MFKNWLERTKIKMTENAKTHAANQAILNMSNTTTMASTSISSGYSTITVNPTGAVGNITAANPFPTNWITTGTVYAGSGVYSSIGATQPTSVISLRVGTSNNEIVRLNKDGSVSWSDEIAIDAAAEAFSKTLMLGAEMAAGITQSVKYRMRDSVFEDIINIAREKGSLTADDLTYLLEASKIVEKLKGPKE